MTEPVLAATPPDERPTDFLLAAAAAVPTAQAGTTTTLTNFGSNPKNLPMYLYTPTNVGAKPPL